MGLSHFNRRGLLTAGTVAVALTPFARIGDAGAESTGSEKIADAIAVDLTVNGQEHHLSLDPRMTLLDALRERMGLTGSKKGCDHGQCGACTVHIGGRRVLSCLTLAAGVREPVTTIEGLSSPDSALHPMQQAFIDHDAFQCGYCTPGQIMSAIACVKEGHAGTAVEIREFMSGNLCRCAAYPHIVAAIQQAKPQMEKA
jgi:xanthine dehydrogenase YagT iron-sulfur-binding subunit